jgi:hypothetical protein
MRPSDDLADLRLIRERLASDFYRSCDPEFTRIALLTTLAAYDARKQDAKTHDELIAILQLYCGERDNSEGAVETLKRICAERAMAQARVKELESRFVEPDDVP